MGYRIQPYAQQKAGACCSSCADGGACEGAGDRFAPFRGVAARYAPGQVRQSGAGTALKCASHQYEFCWTTPEGGRKCRCVNATSGDQLGQSCTVSALGVMTCVPGG